MAQMNVAAAKRIVQRGLEHEAQAIQSWAGELNKDLERRQAWNGSGGRELRIAVTKLRDLLRSIESSNAEFAEVVNSWRSA